MQRLVFPTGFLWGTATSAHQIEGNNKNNDWWRWEHSLQRAEELRKKNKNPEDYYSGLACDSYHRYEEDFDLARSLHQNAHRFSIEWSRVEPGKGIFDLGEIEHYRQVLLALKKRGIKSFVTLHHFTNPVWFADLGGWEKPENVELFLEYARRILQELGDLIDFVCVINEPNIYAGMSYLMGHWPPQIKNRLIAKKVQQNIVDAHIAVYKFVKENNMPIQIGTAHHVFHIQTRGPLQVMQSLVERIAYKGVLDQCAKYADFIGINYYTRQRLQFSLKHPFWKMFKPEGAQSDFGWEIWPEGLYRLFKTFSQYKKPIYLTENGVADAQDRLRKHFIAGHLQSVHRAISEGVNVRGYLHWSLLDNFEWAEGYDMKFGLIAVDRQTLKRQPRPSAAYFAEICKNNYLEI